LVVGAGFTGKKISLDLQDADLITVMRLFAEVADLNIIIAPDVKGKVTVRMVRIPWDQAMDIILRMNGLGYVLEEDILRIAGVGELTREAEEQARSKEAKKKAEDLVTRVISINYSTPRLNRPKILSPRRDCRGREDHTIIIRTFPGTFRTLAWLKSWTRRSAGHDRGEDRRSLPEFQP
jgi:type II secretory pathway component HofQ